MSSEHKAFSDSYGKGLPSIWWAYGIVVVTIIIMIVVITVKYTKKSSGFGSSSSKRNELVFYHADFCGYCHQLMPVFDQTMPELRKRFPGLTITKLQHESDQLAIHQARPPVQGYPTIRLNGAEFEGPRTSEGLMMFVRENYHSHE